jgi:hypothetical protein
MKTVDELSRDAIRLVASGTGDIQANFFGKICKSDEGWIGHPVMISTITRALPSLEAPIVSIPSRSHQVYSCLCLEHSLFLSFNLWLL